VTALNPPRRRRGLYSNRKAVLYRHLDAGGKLLYVGVSNNLLERLTTHRSQAHWFDRITCIRLEHFDTWDEAVAAETKAFHEEMPEYNIADPANPGVYRRPVVGGAS
jgi:predicted GIY-YIG superfamily endonuclease